MGTGQGAAFSDTLYYDDNNDIVQAEARGCPWCGGPGPGEAGAAAAGVEGDQARHLHRHMPQDGPLR